MPWRKVCRQSPTLRIQPRRCPLWQHQACQWLGWGRRVLRRPSRACKPQAQHYNTTKTPHVRKTFHPQRSLQLQTEYDGMPAPSGLASWGSFCTSPARRRWSDIQCLPCRITASGSPLCRSTCTWTVSPRVQPFASLCSFSRCFSTTLRLRRFSPVHVVPENPMRPCAVVTRLKGLKVKISTEQSQHRSTQPIQSAPVAAAKHLRFCKAGWLSLPEGPRADNALFTVLGPEGLPPSLTHHANTTQWWLTPWKFCCQKRSRKPTARLSGATAPGKWLDMRPTTAATYHIASMCWQGVWRM